MVKPTLAKENNEISLPLIKSAEKGNLLHESVCKMIMCALITFTLNNDDL
jgi:hypothetical protein